MDTPAVPPAPPRAVFGAAELGVWVLFALGLPLGVFAASNREAETGLTAVRVEAPGERDPRAAPSLSRLDLNAASAAELELLPGIGPSKAKKIVEYREARGGFRSVDELAQVRGISKGMAERLAPLVQVAP
ncbi:MAG: helix-hairpin-helix domain-containing protein [Planctomycetota bacterium]|nr:helix-hairpin-helix domain-containing protein [Planctomycetota bacterium]